MKFRHMCWLLPALLVALTACEEEQVVIKPVVRAIKTIVVSERAGNQTRKIAGITEAASVSDLSFESAGRMSEILVDIGDRVARGEIIARLDAEPFKLRLATTQGQVREAEARVVDALAKFSQQSKLYQKGFAAKAAYDTALSNKDTAESNLRVVQSQLKLAERDLEKSILRSPVNGLVSAKFLEQFTEVSSGQKIVQISVDGLIKVNANVPEGLVQRLEPNTSVTVTFPTLQDKKANGKITQIAARAGSTNSFPVTIELEKNGLSLRPGLTAEITFSFETEATGKAFLLPLASVLPTSEERKGHIFVFDNQSQTVRRQDIEILNVSDNNLVVNGQIADGDIIAAAGVSFLNDGQKVKLLEKAE